MINQTENTNTIETRTELEVCVKCGEFFMPRLIKPLTICEMCEGKLSEQIGNIAK